MTKGITTIYIDKELVEKAKELEINISKLVNESLFNVVEKKQFDQAEDYILKFQSIKVEAQRAIDRINEAKLQVEEEKKKKIKLLQTTYGHITELNDLTPANLSDVDYMSKLIDMLRAKYNNRYISIAGIREYITTVKPCNL